MVKIRLKGTPQGVPAGRPRLAEVFDVVAVGHPCPNRGPSLVLVYVEVRLGQ